MEKGQKSKSGKNAKGGQTHRQQINTTNTGKSKGKSEHNQRHINDLSGGKGQGNGKGAKLSNSIKQLFQNIRRDGSGLSKNGDSLAKLHRIATEAIDPAVSLEIVRGVVKLLECPDLKPPVVKQVLSLLQQLGTQPKRKLHSAAFMSCFDDLVDVLLGWALTDDLADLRDLVMECLRMLSPQWQDKVEEARTLCFSLSEDVIASASQLKSQGSAVEEDHIRLINNRFEKQSALLECLCAIATSCQPCLSGPTGLPDHMLDALLAARNTALFHGNHLQVTSWIDVSFRLIKPLVRTLNREASQKHYPVLASALLHAGLGGLSTMLPSLRKQREILLLHLELFNKLPARYAEKVSLQIISSCFDGGADEGGDGSQLCFRIGALLQHALSSSASISFWRRGPSSYEGAHEVSTMEKHSVDERDALLETFVALGTGAQTCERMTTEMAKHALTIHSIYHNELVCFYGAALVHVLRSQTKTSIATLVLNTLFTQLPAEPTSEMPSTVALITTALASLTTSSCALKIRLLPVVTSTLISWGFYLIRAHPTQVLTGLTMLHSSLELTTVCSSDVDWKDVVKEIIRVSAKTSSTPSPSTELALQVLNQLACKGMVAPDLGLNVVHVLLRQQFASGPRGELDDLTCELLGNLGPCLLAAPTNPVVGVMGEAHRLQRRLLRWSSAYPDRTLSQEQLQLVLSYLTSTVEMDEVLFRDWCVDQFEVWWRVVDPDAAKATTFEKVRRNPMHAQMWICWEAARTVVHNKLKSHFGGPKETFSALEKALKPASSSRKPATNTDPRSGVLYGGRMPALKGGRLAVSGRGLEGEPSRSIVRAPPVAVAPPPTQRDLIQLRLLLVFFDALEKHMYHAMNGTNRIGHRRDTKIIEFEEAKAAALDSATEDEEQAKESVERIKTRALHSESTDAFVLPALSPTTEAFFRNNRRVCEEWCLRIRSSQMTLASMSLSTMDMIRHGLARLSDLAKRMGMICAPSKEKEMETGRSGRGSDLQRLWADTELNLLDVTKALSSVRDAATIAGLVEWHSGVKKQLVAAAKAEKLSFSPDADTHMASRLQAHFLTAQGHLEQAVVVLSGLSGPEALSGHLQCLGALRQFEVIGTLIGKDKDWGSWSESTCGVARTNLTLLSNWGALDDSNGTGAVSVASPADSLQKNELFVQQFLSLQKVSGTRGAAELKLKAQHSLSPLVVLDGIDPSSNQETLRADFHPWVTRACLLNMASTDKSCALPYSGRSPVKALRLDREQHSLEPWLSFIAQMRNLKNPDVHTLLSLQCALVRLAREQQNYHLASKLIKEIASSSNAPDVRLFCQYEAARLVHAKMGDKNSTIAQDALKKMATTLFEELVCPSHLTSVDALLQGDVTAVPAVQDVVRHGWLLRSLLRLGEWNHETRLKGIGSVVEAAVQVSPGSAKAWLQYANWCFSSEEQSLMKTAASAYRKFLNVSERRDLSLEAALRLLQMLVREGKAGGVEWVAFIGEEMANTPVDVWVRVAPQLLSRLGHPKQHIAEAVLVVLRRLAGHRPLALVTQAVVASTDKHHSNSALQKRYAKLLHQLQLSDQQLVNETDVFVAELNRISFLWDEKWLALIMRVAPELESRVQTLNKDTDRLANNNGLTPQEKIDLCLRRFEAVFSPLLTSLMSLAIATSMQAEEAQEGGTDEGALTPHERRCLEELKPAVHTLISSIKTPKLPSSTITPIVSTEPSSVTPPVAATANTSDFVCFKCGAQAGRYRRWDECLGHVRINHPEVETRRKDSKSRIRDMCRAAAVAPSLPLPPSQPEMIASVLQFDAPNEVWKHFLQLQRILFRNAEDRTHERLRDLSPRLVELALNVTHLTLPTTREVGTLEESKDFRLCRLDDLVTMITTKTRPKQLSMFSADGKRRSYLLKGREDLHLDERVMQFLDVTNDLVRHHKLRAVRFAVVPLGSQSGLIEWVPRAVPLFQVYRRWQKADKRGKVLLQQQSATSRAPTHSSADVPPLLLAFCNWLTEAGGTRQTHEVTSFYKAHPESKQWVKDAGGLRPLCEKYSSFLRFANGTHPSNQQIVLVPQVGVAPHHITNQDSSPVSQFHQILMDQLQSELGGGNEARAKAASLARTPRRSWPRQLLRKVHRRLLEEVPRHLFDRELWLSSSGSSDWWAKQACYARSLAHMSVVGYLLGLGDRHLDNILLDFSTGEVVHIDFGVCFDKGASLKVPELVPCRLTPLLVAALGISAAEGKFRHSCEASLGSMRDHQGLLLGLLETFIYDPLLDWSKDAALALQNRRNEDASVTLTLFAARSSEILPGVLHRCTCTEKVVEFVALQSSINRSVEGRAEALLLSSSIQQERSQLAAEMLKSRNAHQKALAMKVDSHGYESVASVVSRLESLADRCDAITERAEEAITQIADGSLLKLMGSWITEIAAVVQEQADKCVCLEGFKLVQAAVKASGKAQTVISAPQLQTLRQQCVKADSSGIAQLNAMSSSLAAFSEVVSDYQQILLDNNLVAPISRYIAQGSQFEVSKQTRDQLVRLKAGLKLEPNDTLTTRHTDTHLKFVGLLSKFLVEQHRAEDLVVVQRTLPTDSTTHRFIQTATDATAEAIRLGDDLVAALKPELGAICNLVLRFIDVVRCNEEEPVSALELEVTTAPDAELVLAQHLYQTQSETPIVKHVRRLVQLGIKMSHPLVAAARIMEPLQLTTDTKSNYCVCVASRQLLLGVAQGINELSAMVDVESVQMESSFLMDDSVLPELHSALESLSQVQREASVLLGDSVEDARSAVKFHSDAAQLEQNRTVVATEAEIGWEEAFEHEGQKEQIDDAQAKLLAKLNDLGLTAIDRCSTFKRLTLALGSHAEGCHSACHFEMLRATVPPGLWGESSPIPKSLLMLSSTVQTWSSTLLKDAFGLLTALNGGWSLCVRNDLGECLPIDHVGQDLEWVSDPNMPEARRPPSHVRDQIVEPDHLINHGKASVNLCQNAESLISQQFAWLKLSCSVLKLELEAMIAACTASHVNVGLQAAIDVWSTGVKNLIFGFDLDGSVGLTTSTLLWSVGAISRNTSLCPDSQFVLPVPPSEIVALGLPSFGITQLIEDCAIIKHWSLLPSTNLSILGAWQRVVCAERDHVESMLLSTWCHRVEVPRSREVRHHLLVSLKRNAWLWGGVMSNNEDFDAFLEENYQALTNRKVFLKNVTGILQKFISCSESTEPTTSSSHASSQVEKYLASFKEQPGRPIGCRPLVDEKHIRQWRMNSTHTSKRSQSIISDCGGCSAAHIKRCFSSLVEFEQCMVGEQSSASLCRVAGDTLKRLVESVRVEHEINQQRQTAAEQLSLTSQSLAIHESALIKLERRRLAAANHLGAMAVALTNEVSHSSLLLINIAAVLFQSPILQGKKEIEPVTWSCAAGSWNEVHQLSRHAARVLKTEDGAETDLLKQVNDLLLLAADASVVEEALITLIKTMAPQLTRNPSLPSEKIWLKSVEMEESWIQTNSSQALARLSKLTDDTEAKALALVEQARLPLKFAQQVTKSLESVANFEVLFNQVDDVWGKCARALQEVSELAENINQGGIKTNDIIGAGDEDDDDDEEEDDAGVVGEQEKNEFAVQVLARVSDRLKGIVQTTSEPSRLDVASQVSWLISQSTSADNLCQMYEGWAAWI